MIIIIIIPQINVIHQLTSPLAMTMSTTPSWMKYIFVPIVPSFIIISPVAIVGGEEIKRHEHFMDAKWCCCCCGCCEIIPSRVENGSKRICDQDKRHTQSRVPGHLNLASGQLPGWNTSYLSFVTTSDTKFASALAKKGTEATNDLEISKAFTSQFVVCHSVSVGGVSTG